MSIKVWVTGEQVLASDLNNNFAQTLTTQNYTAGEALTAGDLVYLKASDGKVWKADADADESLFNIIGIALSSVSANATVAVQTEGLVTGLSGLTAGTFYYVSSTAGALSATVSNVRVGLAISTTTLLLMKNKGNDKSPVIRTYTPASTLGDNTTRFDVTNPSGTTFRYTYDGTGTDPVINTTTFPTGAVIQIYSPNFSAGNNGTFIVTGSGSNYFEVTNASGVAEVDKTLASTGFLSATQTWTKPAGLKYIIVKMVGSGAGGANGTDSGSNGHGGGGGGGAGYAEKLIAAASLASTEYLQPAKRGGDINPGYSSIFGAHCYATGGSQGSDKTGGAGGIGVNGDINLEGQDGGPGTFESTTSNEGGPGGNGGNSYLGGGGQGGKDSGTSGSPGNLYGGGGGGGGGSGNAAAGPGIGANGIIILTEYY